MKKFLVVFITLLIVSCAGPETVSETETPYSTELAPSLTPIPPPTDQPTSTPAPLPTPTVAPTETPFPVNELLPPGAVLYFSQEGGIMGVMNSWVVYPDGRVIDQDGRERSMPLSDLSTLFDTIKSSALAQMSSPPPSNYCCDFFMYTMVFLHEDTYIDLTISEGDPAFSEEVASTFVAIQQMLTAS